MILTSLLLSSSCGKKKDNGVVHKKPEKETTTTETVAETSVLPPEHPTITLIKENFLEASDKVIFLCEKYVANSRMIYAITASQDAVSLGTKFLFVQLKPETTSSPIGEEFIRLKELTELFGSSFRELPNVDYVEQRNSAEDYSTGLVDIITLQMPNWFSVDRNGVEVENKGPNLSFSPRVSQIMKSTQLETRDCQSFY